MTDIEYEVKRKQKTLPTEEFFNRFSNFELVQGFCKQCPRYNTNYSCSPVNINIKEYIEQYDYIDLIITQIFFKPEDYNREYDRDELNDILQNSFFKEKQVVVDKVLSDEKKYKKAISLTGPCNYCKVKCREEYEHCIHPEKRRYSLASLGIDSKKILKELFDIELLLIEGHLPKYLNNITSILYTE